MICEVCGMEYGLSHNCAGPRSAEAQQIALAGLTPPDGAGAAYYLEQAWKIVRWDDVAIRRNSKDSRATIFGVLFWLAAATFVQLGLCHLIAKLIFGANGKFVELMRPLLLGWFVNCLILIPLAGMLLAGIGWTAVLIIVFEEVEGIGRLQAFGISAAINVCFFAL